MHFCWLSEALRSTSWHQSCWIRKKVLVVHWTPFYRLRPARHREVRHSKRRTNLIGSRSRLMHKAHGTVATERDYELN